MARAAGQASACSLPPIALIRVHDAAHPPLQSAFESLRTACEPGDGHGDARLDPRLSPSLGTRYSRETLRQALLTTGCKPRHAERATERVFLTLQQRAGLDASHPLSVKVEHVLQESHHGSEQGRASVDEQDVSSSVNRPPAHVTVCVKRDALEELLTRCLLSCKSDAPSDAVAAGTLLEEEPGMPPSGSLLRADIRVACLLSERRLCAIVLLCGTSGTGKSTLAALLAARLGLASVISTDSIRHVVRAFSLREQHPLLWASTYEAGWAVQAREEEQAKEVGPGSWGGGAETTEQSSAYAPSSPTSLPSLPTALVLQGYQEASDAVMAHVEALVVSHAQRRASLVVEGVHLEPGRVAALACRVPSCVPFVVHISNAAKHAERFAVRAKAMSLRPASNRYVRSLSAIRSIQERLVRGAEAHALPAVDNTNVDRSVAVMHATALAAARRLLQGERLFDPETRRGTLLLREFESCKSRAWRGRDAMSAIERKARARRAEGGGARRTDGEVEAEAWLPHEFGGAQEPGPLAPGAASAAEVGPPTSPSAASRGGGLDADAQTRPHSELGSVLEGEGPSEDDEGDSMPQ